MANCFKIICFVLLPILSYSQDIRKLTTISRKLSEAFNVYDTTRVNDTTFIVSGIFQSYTGSSFTVDSVAVGQFFWSQNGQKWYIDSVGVPSGKALRIKVKAGLGANPPNKRIGAIIDYSYDYPVQVVGIDATLQTFIDNDFKYVLRLRTDTLTINSAARVDSTFTDAGLVDQAIITSLVLNYKEVNIIANQTTAASETLYIQTPSGASLSDADLGKTLTIIAKDSSATYNVIVSAGDANGIKIGQNRVQVDTLVNGEKAVYVLAKAVGVSEYGYEWVKQVEPKRRVKTATDLRSYDALVGEQFTTSGLLAVNDGGGMTYNVISDTTGLSLTLDSLNLIQLPNGNFAVSDLQDCRRVVKQAAHGFVAGEAVYYTGTAYATMDGVYGDTINPVGIILKVFDANRFLLGECGPWNSDFGLADGLYYSTDAGLSVVPDTAQYPILRVAGNQSTVNPIIPYSDEVDGINLFTITTPSGNNQIIGGESFVLSGDSTIHSGSLRGATLTTVEQALDSLETGRVGRIDIKGTSTSSSNAALKVANSTTTIFTAYENGVVSFLADNEATAVKSIIINADGSYNGAPNLKLFRDAVTFNQAGKIQYTATIGSTPTPYILIQDRSTLSATSGFQREVGIGSTFAPTSGTAVYTTLRITPTVNQTGGANGATAGIRIAPTLTAAADWSSLIIENTSGKGIDQSSTTATNTLAGLTTMTTGIASIPGISGTSTAAKNLRGSVTISDANTTGAVTFGTSETDATYYVTATATGQTGTPAAGSTRVYITSKGTGGFTVNLEVAPGAGNSITVDWIMIR